MALTITDCRATTTSITIVFSEDVQNGVSTDPNSANNAADYTIFDSNSSVFSTPGHPSSAQVSFANPAQVDLTLPTSSLQEGDSVVIVLKNIGTAANPGTSGLAEDPLIVAVTVPGGGGTAGRITRDVEDAIAYPILTEQVGAQPTAPMTGMPGPGAGSIGQIASKAVTDVLGWRVNPSDPKGFVGALTQAFTLTEVEGHTEATWVPRTYAVQTDLGGGITGAQASLYTRAKEALDSSLPLLGGLYALDPEADPEYVKALREMARSQMTEIVKELGTAGGPSVLRVDTYFQILLGQNSQTPPPLTFEPDLVRGTLGSVRDTYGIFFLNNPFSNSVGDEQDITNFRVISDYMTSLLQSWTSNRQFFVVGPSTQQAFFGTQLVLISRQFSVIADTVNEVRFVLDSVFIGASERQTLLLTFPANTNTPPMFLEDILNEVVSFVSDEGPRLMRDGGRIAVTNNILPVVGTLQNLVELAHDPLNINQLPDGFRTVRVRNALDDLADQLQTLFNLSQQVGQQIPTPEEGGPLQVFNVVPDTVSRNPTSGVITPKSVLIAGSGFVQGVKVSFKPTAGTATGRAASVHVVSPNLLTLTPTFSATATFDVVVTNPGRPDVTLPRGITVQ